jgi:hypothetical protein
MADRENETPAEQPANLLWAIDEIIIALQRFRERLKRRLIFKLFLYGDQGSGPMGIKCMVNWLNACGYRTHGGTRWGLGPVHTL